MNANARRIGSAASMLALSAVILAAIGSHAVSMKDLPDLQKIWQTASNIHLFQAAALVGLTALLSNRESHPLVWGAWSMVVGTIVFSGSLYLRVITGNTIAGVTPAGGLLMMVGWGLVLLAIWRKA